MVATSSSFIFFLCLQFLLIVALAAEPFPFSPSKGREKEDQQRVTGSLVIAV